MNDGILFGSFNIAIPFFSKTPNFSFSTDFCSLSIDSGISFDNTSDFVANVDSKTGLGIKFGNVCGSYRPRISFPIIFFPVFAKPKLDATIPGNIG